MTIYKVNKLQYPVNVITILGVLSSIVINVPTRYLLYIGC